MEPEFRRVVAKRDVGEAGVEVIFGVEVLETDAIDLHIRIDGAGDFRAGWVEFAAGKCDGHFLGREADHVADAAAGFEGLATTESEFGQDIPAEFDDVICGVVGIFNAGSHSVDP